MVATITEEKVPGVPTGGLGSVPKQEHLQQGNAAVPSLYVRAFRAVIRTLFRFVFRVRVVGLKNVPRTPVIICANHLGWSETFLVMLFFPVRPRIYVIGEQQVKYISGFRQRVIDSLQVMVMLDRSRPVEALRVMEDVLKRGGSIIIFPEGRLGTEEGKLQELQHGAAHASLMTGVPLLPVGLTGTSELWLRRTLTMRIGKPINPVGYEGDLRTRVRAMTATLTSEMQALLPGDEQNHPGVKPLRNWLTKLL
jgi:1-acyl-sn-glycerol-3-phosphate acyltransferase